MEEQASDVIVGLMMSVFGILGLVLAAHAHDIEMYIFGLSLAALAVLFIGGQVRRHFNVQEAAAAARREVGHD